YAADAGDISEQKPIEKRVQAERTDKAEESPGQSDGERFPSPAEDSDRSENQSERAGKEPSLGINVGISEERVKVIVEAASEPVRGHRRVAFRLRPRPMHPVQAIDFEVRQQENAEDSDRRNRADDQRNDSRPENDHHCNDCN